MELLLKKGQGKFITVLDSECESSRAIYKEAKKAELFEGKKGESFGNLIGPGEVLWGLGSLEDAYESGFMLSNMLKKAKVESAQIDLTVLKEEEEAFKLFVEGILNAQYSFDNYKKADDKEILQTIYLIGVTDKKKALEEVQGLVEGITLTKNLVNTRSIDMYPETLAKACVDELVPLGVEVEVYGLEDIEEIGMKAFLEVSRGSSKEPRLIVMNYQGDKASKKTVALVGKGLTYDSGGYGIKTTDGMYSMFTDMAGSATVIGVMKSLALNKVEKNVVAIVAACENMINGEAYKNGDIISSLYGKTIEIFSTDAEGRLTLADAVTYAERRFQPSIMLDVATLTGACARALGNVALGVYGNDDKALKQLLQASQMAHENAWLLPDFEEYREQIKSNFADVKNSGGPGAGATTAGMFIEEFIDNTPWVHLDIAGTSYRSNPKGIYPAGATGFATKMIYYFAVLYK